MGVGPFQVSFHSSAASVAYPITVNSVPSTAEMVNDIGATYQLSLPRIHVLLALEFTQLPVWLLLTIHWLMFWLSSQLTLKRNVLPVIFVPEATQPVAL